MKYIALFFLLLVFSIHHSILYSTKSCTACQSSGGSGTFGSCGACGGAWCSSRPLCDPCTPRSGPCPCGKCRCKCIPCEKPGDVCETCCQTTACGYPFFAYRSTGINAVRNIVGIQSYINRYGMDTTSGVFSVALEYTRSFRPNHIAQFLFGSDLCWNTLAIQGSQIIGFGKRICCALLADYFGLSPAFDSRISFYPRIENVIINLDLYFGLDGATEGLYFRIYSPITWTRWNLNMHECIINSGIVDEEEIGFDHGYMSEAQIAKENLPRSFTEVMCGRTTWGDMKTPLKYGRIPCGKLTRTNLADIHTVFGWNFVRDEDYHFGANLQAVFPAGNKPCPKYLFEPQVGDQKHWQLGGGITSKWIIWRNDENYDNYLGLYFDANLLHLLKNCQCRSFDFCCKPNSRYMLLAQMGNNADDIAGTADGTTTSSYYQYKKNLIPAIHYSTFNVEVVIDIQAELVFKLGYVKDNWSFDLGYNFWGRTGERFIMSDCCCCRSCCDDIKYAIKGDAILYGYTPSLPGGIADAPFAMSSSQSKADIHAGQNMKLTDTTLIPAKGGIDNPQLASAGGAALYLYGENPSLAPDPPHPIQLYTSIQPELISCDNVNICKSASAISHKIFAHVNYAGKERADKYTPYIGLGGQAEFDNSNETRFSVAQWGIWLKGGVAFE